jgi:hypothetical protein
VQRKAELLEQAQNFGRTIIEAEQQFGAMLKEIFPWGGNREKQAQGRLSLEFYGITGDESMLKGKAVDKRRIGTKPGGGVVP